ncbi:MAG: hypothetical protein KKB39_01650 [Nanoarchaeota archaeon]|nr:hypothetical protein [Nanoarchaeota archaeon]
MKYFFIFLLLMPITSAIAVWPESLEFNEQYKSITVYNNLQNETYYNLILKNIGADENNFKLKPNEQKRIELKLKSNKAEVLIEEFYNENQNVINSIKLPLKINFKIKNYNLYYILSSIALLIIILFITLKKKYLNSNK